MANPVLESFSFSSPTVVFDYLDETLEETSPTAPPPAPIQAPTFILPLPGQSVDQLCVDIKSTPGPLLLLLSDPDQGLEVTGEYKMEKAQFSWIEVTFKNPQLQVHVSPEHVVVTRDRRSSQYKWKETLFVVMPGVIFSVVTSIRKSIGELTMPTLPRGSQSTGALGRAAQESLQHPPSCPRIIDGVTYPGNIKQKDAAQKQYSAAVARGESAGLVKATGRKMEQFQVSVSVAPAAKVTFELVYEELLKRRLGVYELLLKVQPQQLVKHLQMDIHIFEPQGISFLETESTFMTNELADALTVSQNQTKAHIRFKPTLSQQQKSAEQQDTVVDGDFIIRYDVNRTLSGGSIQIENGYFVHYFAPEGLSTIPKNVIFVIDTSGSMMGKKIQQTREALIKILEDLRPEDHFNLISFSSEASQWKPSLVPASTQNVEEAKKYANSIQARGGTNINDAMLMAVQLLDTATREEQLPSGSVSLLLLLTDGDPTVGQTNPRKIQKNVQEAIGGQYSLFCLGFGFDVSYAFLEKLALDNGGLARRIYEDSDSALQLQDFYQEVANPLLTTVTFEYPGNAVEEVTQDNFPLFFKGSEMVVAGKLRAQIPDVLSATVSGQLPTENITFQMESQVAKQEEEFQKPKYIFHGFMERLWAYLTIHQLLEQMVSAYAADKQALETQALGLSLNYSFVTPLTSMVTKPAEGQEQSQVAEKPVENEKDPSGLDVFRYGAMGHPLPKGAVGFASYAGVYDVPNRRSGPPGLSAPSHYHYKFLDLGLDRHRLPSGIGEPLSDLGG
ncbi:PREDICTED: inter-alpha-trypsin inhibitor heavy chain H4, partial [Myotis brandtii]|uniref:inter-alpha-trypsin inhibitor heavy chain H4 n=1 Tax=Myotis brandtii TaxID=109478 RepID=UPI000703EB21